MTATGGNNLFYIISEKHSGWFSWQRDTEKVIAKPRLDGMFMKAGGVGKPDHTILQVFLPI